MKNLKVMKLVGALVIGAMISLCGCQAEGTPEQDVQAESIEVEDQMSEEGAEMLESEDLEAVEPDQAESEAEAKDGTVSRGPVLAPLNMAVKSGEQKTAVLAPATATGTSDANIGAAVIESATAEPVATEPAVEADEASGESESKHHSHSSKKSETEDEDDGDESDEAEDEDDDDDNGESEIELGEPLEKTEEVEEVGVVLPWDEIDKDNMPVMWGDGVIRYPDGTEIYPENWQPPYILDEDGNIYWQDKDGEFHPGEYNPGGDGSDDEETVWEEGSVPQYPIIDENHQPAFPPTEEVVPIPDEGDPIVGPDGLPPAWVVDLEPVQVDEDPIVGPDGLPPAWVIDQASAIDQNESQGSDETEGQATETPENTEAADQSESQESDETEEQTEVSDGGAVSTEGTEEMTSIPDVDEDQGEEESEGAQE